MVSAERRRRDGSRSAGGFTSIEMHIAIGNPCRSGFQTYHVNG